MHKQLNIGDGFEISVGFTCNKVFFCLLIHLLDGVFTGASPGTMGGCFQVDELHRLACPGISGAGIGGIMLFESSGRIGGYPRVQTVIVAANEINKPVTAIFFIPW